MKRQLFFYSLLVFTLLFVGTGTAQAGAKVKIDEDSSIDLGFRLQTLYILTDRDINSDNSFESYSEFKVRRARIRFGADITNKVSMFLQTEIAGDSATGLDMRMIDAFITLKPDKWSQIVVGELMSPALRQNLTSSGALLAIDRPAIVYKSLTWGARAPAAFTNTNLVDTDSGLRGGVDVRDAGLTLFGSGSIGTGMSLKYYAGIYDGIQDSTNNASFTGKDSERYTARVQLNFGDPEPGYFSNAMYLGQKKTIGVGVSYDAQSDVDFDTATSRSVDYALYTADVFAEHPIGPGTLTVEAAYINLDLNDASIVDVSKTAAPSLKDFRQAQGDGYYVQAGYLVKNWQPWIEYETWSSDDANNIGSFDSMRFGVSYFIHGHNANIKAGYEIFNSDANFTDVTSEDKINTFVLGFYVTY